MWINQAYSSLYSSRLFSALLALRCGALACWLACDTSGGVQEPDFTGRHPFSAECIQITSAGAVDIWRSNPENFPVDSGVGRFAGRLVRH